MPRRTNGKPNWAPLAAMRMSVGNSKVAPMPTAAPLIAAITGLFASKMRIVSAPPESRLPPCKGL